MTLEGNSVGYLFWFLLGLGTLLANHEPGEPSPALSRSEQGEQPEDG